MGGGIQQTREAAALPALTLRVRANLNYLRKQRGKVAKIGERVTARWTLAVTEGTSGNCRLQK